MDTSATNASLPPDESRGPAILVISWLCVAVAIFFVACRVYTRFRITHNAALDDALLAISVVLFIITIALNSASIRSGLGRHIVYLQPEQISYTLYLSAILQPIGIFAIFLPKLAVVVLIVKLMGPKKHGISFLYFIVTILAIGSALSSIFVFAQCDPPSHFWNPTEPAHCWSPNVLRNRRINTKTAWSAFVDLSLAIFPITVLWDLQMKRSRKIGISILMGLGIFAMACAIVKTTCLSEEEQPDFTWDVYGLWIWTFIGIAVVIVCACAPTLPPLVLLLLGKDQESTHYQRSRPNQPQEQSHSGKVNSSYDKILDKTATPGRADEVEMQPVSNERGIRRVVDIHTQWEWV
ncbi:MAG: hypothetical protein ASARMPREDX12_009040 [Alectoria sarmentosa]|nr:MAG: hypothetical protein ASARMPRED_007150 [Alectoria sarmentosa]CAD6594482.1 MAG: hypothetical protein ASARMPREDX12_009040 [Alectoria sarmentosa]